MTRIVYLHGFASSPSSNKALYFRDLLEKAGASVRIPQLDGGDFEHLTLTGQLAVVERAVAEIGLSHGDDPLSAATSAPVTLIGSSMGGYLAALYAARHAEVRQVVLMAPAFGFARRWAAHLGPVQMESWRRTGAMNVFHYGLNRNCSLGYELMADAERYEEYPDFHQPTLIFHGAQDDVVPVEYSRKFAGSHLNATLEVLKSGHELLDVVEYMGRRVAKFLGLRE
jgi:uncharacterized protein